MIKLILAFAVILTASSAQAQSRRSLKDIDRELKQTKSTATTLALIESIAETIPQTDEDVVTLGQLMDKYPTQGQKATAKIKNPKLAKMVQVECAKKIEMFKGDKEKDWSKLPGEERASKLNAFMSSQVLITTLGNLKDKDSIPFLKQFITPEYDGTLSYAASQAIGKIAPDDPAIFKELWDKSGEMRNINYGAYRKSALREISERMQDKKISVAEKTKLLGRSQIELRGASDAEEKKLLKDLVKKHPNGEMRETAAQSLMHSMKDGFEPDDKVYLKQWLANENEGSIGWALYVVRDHWDAQYTPELLKVLKNSKWNGARSSAAEILGQNKIKESLLYLEECCLKDKDSYTRSSCREAYWNVSGKTPAKLHPDDVRDFERNSHNPIVEEYYSKRSSSDPKRIQYEEMKRVVEEAKRHQK